ncbi:MULTISPECIES: hypothetical protein [unclassified Cryobacterium]|uniref:hypothetical protein n=1 Tax=unclassified Cryobacterium TaxID=2649013 RepID=UPI002AB3BBC3|nr:MULTISPECIES: hypothetical protein [Cryobacterium]MDY7530008.1 hypothetical protein [Cryobacterium sp. 10C2]MDY7555343.1 hypothetical protein [Cryobacterium sp. 10C3]MEB0202644.1 hypothetical protein [Cryobacterium sp. 5I3]MEB0292533.1 hypothetical protein [Cryobacterium sp. 10C2]MEC5148833.1 hypothetical protein [Cryobacterium psychrotolerans]
MTQKLTPEARAKLFLWIGIGGILIVIADVVFMVLNPPILANYALAGSAIGLIVVGFGSYRVLKKPIPPK